MSTGRVDIILHTVLSAPSFNRLWKQPIGSTYTFRYTTVNSRRKKLSHYTNVSTWGTLLFQVQVHINDSNLTILELRWSRAQNRPQMADRRSMNVVTRGILSLSCFHSYLENRSIDYQSVRGHSFNSQGRVVYDLRIQNWPLWKIRKLICSNYWMSFTCKIWNLQSNFVTMQAWYHKNLPFATLFLKPLSNGPLYKKEAINRLPM